MNSPISKKEITSSIRNKQFIDVQKPKDVIWSRKHHIQRIAWLVCNFSDDYPIEIDVGIPGFCYLYVDDGNHRIAAAIYLKKKYIQAVCGGSISEIEKYR